jgi:hypothetical protein
VEPVPSTRDHDPDLDPPRRPRVQLRDPLPEEYQRLVANPFLALLGLIVWFWAIVRAYQLRNPIVLAVTAASLAVVFFLPQYHCRDCGTTGRLYRWREHACGPVLARRLSDRPRRYRGPNPSIQMTLWLYLLLAVALLVGIVYGVSF